MKASLISNSTHNFSLLPMLFSKFVFFFLLGLNLANVDNGAEAEARVVSEAYQPDLKIPEVDIKVESGAIVEEAPVVEEIVVEGIELVDAEPAQDDSESDDESRQEEAETSEVAVEEPEIVEKTGDSPAEEEPVVENPIVEELVAEEHDAKDPEPVSEPEPIVEEVVEAPVVGDPEPVSEPEPIVEERTEEPVVEDSELAESVGEQSSTASFIDYVNYVKPANLEDIRAYFYRVLETVKQRVTDLKN